MKQTVLLLILVSFFCFSGCSLLEDVGARYERNVNLAMNALQSGHFAASRGYWQNALPLAATNIQRGEILDYIGFTHYFEGDYTQAKNYFEQSASLGTTMRNRMGQLHTDYWSRSFDEAYLHGKSVVDGHADFVLTVGEKQIDLVASRVVYAFLLAILNKQTEFDALAPQLDQITVHQIRGVFFP